MVRNDIEIVTDRLALRPVDRGDIHRLAEYLGAADVPLNLGRAPYPYGVQDARAFTAGHYLGSPASGAVLAKLGFEVVGEVEWFALAKGCKVGALRYWRGAVKAVDALRTNTH